MKNFTILFLLLSGLFMTEGAQGMSIGGTLSEEIHQTGKVIRVLPVSEKVYEVLMGKVVVEKRKVEDTKKVVAAEVVSKKDTEEVEVHKVSSKIKEEVKTEKKETKEDKVEIVQEKKTENVEKVVVQTKKETPKETPKEKKVEEETKPAKVAEKKYNPNTLYFAGKSVPYKNGGVGNGQSIIDGGVYASTWGGAPNFSGTDGSNTHFIGHNPGVFTGMHESSTFIVTDSNGVPFTYVRTKRYVVNEVAIDQNTGEDHRERIVGTGGGERITLQSTVAGEHPKKWIIEAILQ